MITANDYANALRTLPGRESGIASERIETRLVANMHARLALALALACATCSSEDFKPSSGVGGNGTDAAADSSAGFGGVDGSGMGGATGLDASSDADADTDANPKDAAAPISVSVVDASDNVLSNVTVVVHGTDGMPLSTTLAPTGQTSVAAPIGGWVSALHKSSFGASTAYLITSARVAAKTKGVVLPIKLLPALLPENQPMTLKFTLPGTPQGEYSQIHLPCANGSASGTSGTVTGFKGCRGTSSFDVVVTRNDTNGDLKVWGSLLQQPFVANGTANLTVDVTNTNFVTSAVTIKPIPLGTERADATLWGFRGELHMENGPTWVPPAVEETTTLKIPGGFFSRLVLDLRVDLTSSYPDIVAYYKRSGTVVPTTANWNPTALAILEQSTTVSFASDPVYATVNWALAPSGKLGDVLFYTQYWTDTAARYHGWDVLVEPSHNGSFSLPKLPTELAEYAAPAATNAGHYVRHIDAVLANGYDAFLGQYSFEFEANADEVNWLP